MGRTIEEQIEVMQHFANGGEVEYFSNMYKGWTLVQKPFWDWHNIDYRIKEQKKIVTIEKWLCKSGDNSYYIVETSDISGYEKVKLLETYEVEL